MLFESCLTTSQILALFSEEINIHGGHITDTFHEGERLFSRSVLSRSEEVRPGDRLRGGVALKANGKSVWLHPYVLRQVCQNGAIMAESLASLSIMDVHQLDPGSACEEIREAIEACCAPEVFQDNVRRMRTACEMNADMLLNSLPLVTRYIAASHPHLIQKIMENFFQDGDRSPFGLANAVTAVARDVQDPDVRWNLEEFGGGIAIRQLPPSPVDSGHAERCQSEPAVEVG